MIMDKRILNYSDLLEAKSRGAKSLYPEKPRLMVGMASCGLALGAADAYEILEKRIQEGKVDAVLYPTGCIGYCEREPLVDVLMPGGPRVIYQNVGPERAERIASALAENKMPERGMLCYINEDVALVGDERVSFRKPQPDFGEGRLREMWEIPFYKPQVKIALRNCGYIDPGNIEHYIARGGYASLHKVLTGLTSEQVIEIVSRSGLRGRGGAGFPTGRKWQFCRAAEGNVKYIICNADEGDPGAYMDRSILEGDPHSVLEGMIIGGYAIGAHEAYIYVRAEYPIAVKRFERAIAQAEDYGFLGDNIFGSGFSFKVHVRRGGGAFVCGEETALIASVEGKIGEPRPRPPYPAQSGLFGCPTVINNVETWANIPVIIDKGAEWYSSIGTEKSKGTKVFSLVGAIRNTGLVEVPMGISLRRILEEIGGGIAGGKKFKAVQIGGPSGGCIPEEHLDIPVDYERLTEVGAMMGSGGMVVMDEDSDMVDIARYFLSFTVDESCGKCTPCREGIKQMLAILDRILKRQATRNDVEMLGELASAIKDSSLCGLGKTAPNPVLTTLRYFRNEYEALLKEEVAV